LPEEVYEKVQSDQKTSKLRFKMGTSWIRKWGTPNSRATCGESAVNRVIMEIICIQIWLLLCHTLIPSFFSHPVHSLSYSVKFTAELCSYCFKEMQHYEVEITPCSAPTSLKIRPIVQKLKEGWTHGR
jgi:hypothetical protein